MASGVNSDSDFLVAADLEIWANSIAMGAKSKRTWIALTCMAALIACETARAGAVIKVPMTEKRVAAFPKGPDIAGPLPRPLLMVNLQERGEYPGDRTVSSYWAFDPALPEKGLRKIFSGPGQSQYLRFMTPLFGGYGLASGRLDREKEPDRDGPWFWFNPLEGKAGPGIEIEMCRQWMDDGWFVGEQTVHGKDGGSVSRIIRYDPLKAVARTTELDFSYINWLGKSEVVGVAKFNEGERVVRLDVEKSEYEVIGTPPPDCDSKGNRMYGFGVYPAGKNCRDGVFATYDFSLWFLPKGGEWHSVIRDVHIVKTFGGAMPWLPVSYVGNGRFAVAKTVTNEVEVPKETPGDQARFGAAETVTMFIDGVTGKVLKQTKPAIYNHNPKPMIPDDWWAADMKPKPPGPEVKVESLFNWDEKNLEVRFAGNQVVKLNEDHERDESGDGRYLVIYQKCPRGGGKAKTKVPFRILDSKTGQVHSAEVASDFHEVWVEVTWQVLCSESPDAKTLKDFQNSGPGPE